MGSVTGRFIGGESRGGSAANYSHVQLWNPAASGFILEVTKLKALNAASLTSHNFRLHYYATALTTDSGKAGPKYLGGAGGVGQVRTQLQTSVLGTALVAIYHVNYNDINFDWVDDFIAVPENMGLVVVNNAVNEAISAEFEWREKPTS